jgi:hypothetical protein
VTARSLATVLVWTGYGVVALIVLAVRLMTSSARLDVGQVVGSVIFLGGAGVFAAAALLAGSVIGTYVLTSDRGARRVGFVALFAAGWIGFAVLAWLLWGFWTN